MAISTGRSSLGPKVAVALFVGLLVFLYGEITLAAPIIFLVNIVGLWAAYVIFCIAITALALVEMRAIELWFGKWKQEARDARPDGRQRLVLRALEVAKVLGLFAAAVVLGPVFGSPLLRVVGYSRRSYYAFAVGSAWPFGAIWVPFYGIGVWGLGLSRLF